VYSFSHIYLTSDIIEIVMHLQNWRNGFAQAAIDTINLFIKNNQEYLSSKEVIAEQVAKYLIKVDLLKNGEISTEEGNDDNPHGSCTYAYEWDDWSTEATERKV
jgi:hypothetical protein